MLYLRTFGGCSLERDGALVDEFSAQRKSLAFLALLAGAGSRGSSRDVAATLLWPESDEERARASLKQLAHALRTRLAVSDVVFTNGDLRLNPERATSDVEQFREALRKGELETAARLYAGPFLDGFYLRGCAEFERWTSRQRGALAQEFVGALRRLAEQADQRGDRTAAVAWWRRLVDADPLSAPATLGFMRALDAAGEQAAALRHAGIFQQLIREELESEPDPSVMALTERLRSMPTASPVERPVLVVLPFANTSGDQQEEHFSDGLTDELIGTIGKMPGIAVVGRTSAFACKGQALDIVGVGAKLNATSVLEGSVRRLGERFKVGVQLVRVSDGVVLWSEIYDRDTADLFAVQTEIAHSVSLALHVRLGPGAATTPRPRTTDAAAQEFYLRGRYFLNRVSAADLRQAVACFRRAVERDPAYAHAYAGLADAHLLLAIMGHAPPGPEVASTHAALARALALDGSLAEAHASLACVLFAFDWEWNEAEREFDAAIRLDPGYGLAHHRYGLFLMYQARFDEAQQVLEAARAADPLAASLNMNLGRLHLSAHRPERAVPLLEAATELSPQLALAHEQLGHAYLRLNAENKALAQFQRVAELSGPRGATRLAYALAVTGDRLSARKLVREITERSDAAVHAFGLAMACTGLGELDDGFAWLDRAYSERDAFLHTIKATPAFEPLHADARWPVLLTRIGLRAGNAESQEP